MFYKSFPLLVIGLWGVIVLPLPNRVSAITPLTRAEIQDTPQHSTTDTQR